jgi:flagellar assembly factor FliW
MDYDVVLPILGFNEIDTLTLEKVEDPFFRLFKKPEGIPAFTLVHPAALRNDYLIEIPDQAVEKLGLVKEEDALVLNIMILDTPIENSHVNFMAPLVFNTSNGKMGQVILDSAKYPDFGLADPLKNYLDVTERSS